jgi:hypothetical protein
VSKDKVSFSLSRLFLIGAGIFANLDPNSLIKTDAGNVDLQMLVKYVSAQTGVHISS